VKIDHSVHIGTSINRWTILSVRRLENGTSYFVAKCICGNERTPRVHHVLKGVSKSCGCYLEEGMAHRKPKGYAGLTSVLIGYKKNAETRGLTFELNRDQFKQIAEKDCFYCGEKPSNKCAPYAYSYKNSKLGLEAKEHAAFIYNGLDRIDNTLGYSSVNVVPCCKMCNYAKNNSNQKDFFDWVKRIYFNLRSKNVFVDS
jgi:hypothetical protein